MSGTGRRAAAERDGESPFLAGELHGLRQWSLESPEGDFLLAGYFGVPWTPGGEPTEAACHADDSWHSDADSHQPPGHDCGCGLYGLHPDPEIALPVVKSAPGVDGNGLGESLQLVGVIEAWGRVELREDGFRAEYARPVVLVASEAVKGSDYGMVVARVASRYRAEVFWFEQPQEVFDFCRERGFGLSRQTVGRLLAERPAESPSDGEISAGEVVSPSGREQTPTRWERIRDFAVTAAAVVFAGAFYLAGAAIAVVIVLAIIDYEDPKTPVRVGKPDPGLSAVREWVERRGGHQLYIARGPEREPHEGGAPCATGGDRFRPCRWTAEPGAAAGSA